MALKENIRIEGRRDIQTKVMTTLFALFAEVERDLISERTWSRATVRARRGRRSTHYCDGPSGLPAGSSWFDTSPSVSNGSRSGAVSGTSRSKYHDRNSRTWPNSPRSAASPVKRSPVITASRRSRARGRPRRRGWWQVARTVGAVRRPERPRLAPAALAGARPWSWRLAALGPTSPSPPTARASSVTVRRGKTNQEGEDAGTCGSGRAASPGRAADVEAGRGETVRGRLT